MSTDLNDYDVIENVLNPEVHEYRVEKEKVDALEDLIKSQYEKFDFLGNDYLKNSENTIIDSYHKREILKNLLNYVDKYIINIVDIDSVYDDSNRLDLIGSYIYEFICVDCVSSLLPSFFELNSLNSIEDFDLLMNFKYSKKPSDFKNDFLKPIELTINQLLKLQNISPIVKNDENYNRLYSKYLFYKDTIEFCDTEKFINNYIRPVINKYISDITWRRF